MVNIVYLPIADEMPRLAVALAWHKKMSSPALTKLTEAVMDPSVLAQLGELSRRAPWTPSVVGKLTG